MEDAQSLRRIQADHAALQQFTDVKLMGHTSDEEVLRMAGAMVSEALPGLVNELVRGAIVGEGVWGDQIGNQVRDNWAKCLLEAKEHQTKYTPLQTPDHKLVYVVNEDRVRRLARDEKSTNALPLGAYSCVPALEGLPGFV